MSASDLELFTKKANKCIKEGQYSDAEYYFKKIIEIEDNNWQAWYGRGLCLKYSEMYERAIMCFSRVTELSSKNAKAWYNLGFCQSQIDLIEEALFNLNKAIKLDKDYPIIHLIKAWIYRKHNNRENSQRLINHVKDNFPEFIEKLSAETEENNAKDYKIAIEMLGL